MRAAVGEAISRMKRDCLRTPCPTRSVGGALGEDAPRNDGITVDFHGHHSSTTLNPLIRVEGVTRTYRIDGREVPALRGVDLTVTQGELVSLRGRSGSGKTTLLNCIGGLDRPTSGKVWIEGREVTQLSEAEACERAAPAHRLCVSVVRAAAHLFGGGEYRSDAAVGGRERSRRAKAPRGVCADAGRPEEVGHPSTVSNSRAGSSSAWRLRARIVTRPALILADEPTGELDSATGQQIMELFREIVDREQTTVLIATHNLAVDMFADRVCLLEDGQIREVIQASVSTCKLFSEVRTEE